MLVRNESTAHTKYQENAACSLVKNNHKSNVFHPKNATEHSTNLHIINSNCIPRSFVALLFSQRYFFFILLLLLQFAFYFHVEQLLYVISLAIALLLLVQSKIQRATPKNFCITFCSNGPQRVHAMAVGKEPQLHEYFIFTLTSNPNCAFHSNKNNRNHT